MIGPESGKSELGRRYSLPDTASMDIIEASVHALPTFPQAQQQQQDRLKDNVAG